MRTTRNDFVPKFIKILERELNKQLPMEGFESEMIDKGWKIIIEKCKHIMGAFLVICMLILTSCTAKAYKQGDTMVLKGWGVTKATWPEGYSIEKAKPGMKVPDIMSK